MSDASEKRNCSIQLKTGSAKGWQLYSISRWTKEDGMKLKKHLEIEFEKGNRNIFWDDVVMFLYFDKYKLGIRKMRENDVKEIDTLEEYMSCTAFLSNDYLIPSH